MWRKLNFVPVARRFAAVAALSVALLVVVVGQACGGSPAAPSSASPPSSPQPAAVLEMPTSLPARSPLEEAIKGLFLSQFGELVFRPAIYNDPNDCPGAGHLTSTFYTPNTVWGQGYSTLETLYTSRDGTEIIPSGSGRTAVVMTPAGHFRVLVALLTWPATVSAADLPLWEAAQASINEDHAAFARSRGYGAPIVSFESTNVLIPGSEVSDPYSAAGIQVALSNHGIAWTGYDFVVMIDNNPNHFAGGLAFGAHTRPAFISMGNFNFKTTALSASDWRSTAAAVYHHEVAHHWGWPGTHDWSPTCTAKLWFAPLIAAPILFGWEDTDGDGIPEILDPTPYGRSR